ncbi:MAG TPA: flotillin family protein, partial [Sphingopyxis sp.]|nr:flotillin family protein [Sphingopyxis sp.]
MASPIPGTGNRLLGAVNSMMIEIAIYAGIGLAVLLILGLIITRLYRRATKEIAFVRTGFRGERVIMNG